MVNDKDLIIFYMALSAVGLYAAFLPNVAELAANYQTPDERKVIREAELIGTAHLLIVAVITSSVAKSALPLLLALLLGGSMFATYEYALSRVPGDKIL